jgi:hypothetical protein
MNTKIIGNMPGPNGQITFSMDYDTLLVQSANSRQIAIYDEQLKKVDGKTYFDARWLKLGSDFPEIEIPTYILQARDEKRKENGISRGTIGCTESHTGKIIRFLIGSGGQLIARLGEKEVISDKIEEIEGKKAVNVQALCLDVPFIEVPDVVEKAFLDAKRGKELQDLHLVYAGRSLLTGQDYFKLSCDIPGQMWDRVKNLFEWLGEDEQPGRLSGWATTKPELAEEYLHLRKNTVKDREAEITKQKAKAKAAQEKEFKIKIG